MPVSSESTPLLSTSDAVNLRTGSHYLTTPRFIAYQLVSLFSAIDGLAGTYTLTSLKKIEAIAIANKATINYNDGFLAGLMLILGGTVAGLICGIVFLIMMLHPAHNENRKSVLAKEGIFSVAVLGLLGILIYSTVVVATRSAELVTPGFSHKERAALLAEIGSLAYRHLVPAIVFLVLGWVMWFWLFVSLLLVSRSARRVLAKGPVLDAHRQLPERLADRFLQHFFGIRLSDEPL